MPNSSSKFLLSNTVHATYRLNIITTTFTYVQPNAHKTQLQFPQPNYQQKNPPSKKERTSYSLTLTRRHRRKVRSCFSRQRSPHRLLSYPGHTSNECEIKKAEKKKKASFTVIKERLSLQPILYASTSTSAPTTSSSFQTLSFFQLTFQTPLL